MVEYNILNYVIRKFYTEPVIGDKTPIDLIIENSHSQEQRTAALKAYKKLVNNIFEVQFNSKLKNLKKSQAKDYLIENAQMMIIKSLLKLIEADKKGGTDIYSAVSKFEEFLNDPNLINDFVKDFLQPSHLSATQELFLEQLSSGFFDRADISVPRLSKSIQNLIGRTQESTDFFNGLPLRVVNAFIASRFALANSYDGINYGNGQVLGINEIIPNFIDVEKSLLGVSDSWASEFESFSSRAPSDRRYFDNLLIRFLNSYLSSPNKGSLGKVETRSIRGMINDFISASFSTLFIEGSENTKLKDIPNFLATLAVGGSNDQASILTYIFKNLFSNRERLQDFTTGSSPKELKMPSKFTFLFAITDWINTQANLDSSATKTEAIKSVKDFFWTFKDATHNNYGKLKEFIRSIASKYYRNDYVSKMGLLFIKSIERLFTNDDFLNSMIQTNIEGYHILWRDNFNIFIEKVDGEGNPIKFTRDSISNTYNGEPVYILDGNSWTPLETLRSDYSFDSAHILVHRITENSEIQIGLTKIENIRNDFSHLSFELHEGFPTANGLVSNIWVSNSKGNQLISDINLDDFSIRSETDEFWYKQYFDSSGRPLSNIYISYLFSSGLKMTNYLQQLNLGITSYSSFTPFFPDLVTQNIVSLKGYSNTFKPLLGIDRVQAYGKEFTVDTVNKIIYDLFDPSRNWKNNLYQQQVIKHLAVLNGYFKGGLNNEFVRGQDIQAVNKIVKDLSFSKDELQKFSWKKPDGSFIGSEQFLKQWLSLIYTKITSYYLEGGQNPDINNEAKKLLAFTSLETIINPKKFTNDEQKTGVQIFQTASKLFGHFTIRLALSSMIDFNSDNSIMFLSRPSNLADLTKIHNHIGFVATRAVGDSPIANYQDTNNLQHLIGAFFLDSHIYLPLLSGQQNRENSYIFDFGPILISTRLQSRSLKAISWKIASFIADTYERSATLYSLFYKSQSNLLKKIELLINDKIFAGQGYFSGNKDKNKWLAAKLINQARKQLFHLGTRADLTYATLRRQFEDQMLDTSKSYIELNFKGIIDIPRIVLKFPKSWFADSDFQTWGYVDTKSIKWDGMVDHKNRLLETEVANGVKLLTKLIAEHGSGKVIILPMINTDHSNLGYRHYYGAQSRHVKWLPYGKSYFEIDLNDAPKALSQLIHITRSMLTYDAAFVVKEWVDIDASYGNLRNYLDQNREMICAFDYRGFLKRDELYVGDPASFGTPWRARAPIEIDDYSTNFYENTEFNNYANEWVSTFIYRIGMTDASKNSDFTRYLASIITGTSGFSIIMREILGL